MKIIYIGSILLLFLISFSFFHKPSLAEKLTDLKKINLCMDLDSLIKLPRDTSMKGISISKYSFVMYVDSASCSTCALKDMVKWNQYLEDISQYHILFYPIFFPKKQDKTKFEYMAISQNNSFPIYIDTLNYFEKKNPILKGMNNINTFMIDIQGRIIIVGNPTKNPNIKKLVKEFLAKDYSD